MGLNRDAILECSDLPREELDIPEWGGKVIIRALTISEGEGVGNAVAEAKKNGEKISYGALLAAASIVDENGNRIFSDADVVPLSRKSRSAIQRIVDAAERLSGVGQAAHENAIKNS